MQIGEQQTKQNTVQGRSIEDCYFETGIQADFQTAGLRPVPYLLTIRLRRPLLVGPLTQRMSQSQLTLKAALCLARQEYSSSCTCGCYFCAANELLLSDSGTDILHRATGSRDTKQCNS